MSKEPVAVDAEALKAELAAAKQKAADFESIVDKAEAETEEMRARLEKAELAASTATAARRVDFGLDAFPVKRAAVKMVTNEEVIATATGYDGGRIRQAGDRFMFTGALGSWMRLVSEAGAVDDVERQVRAEIEERRLATEKTKQMFGNAAVVTG